MPEQPRACIYCGAPIDDGRTCWAHRDLVALDPLGTPARRPLTEQQHGLRPAHPIRPSAGRREAY